MLFLYYVLLYFALSITSAAAPTGDLSQSSHGLNPEAAEFRPAGPPPPMVVDGTIDPNMPQYTSVVMTRMKTPEELGLELGQLYNIRKSILVGHDFHLSNPRNSTVCYRVSRVNPATPCPLPTLVPSQITMESLSSFHSCGSMERRAVLIFPRGIWNQRCRPSCPPQPPKVRFPSAERSVI
jgi:hypothetical protein